MGYSRVVDAAVQLLASGPRANRSIGRCYRIVRVDSDSSPTSEGKAEDGVVRVASCIRWGHTHMVSAIGVIPITLHLDPWNGNVLPILAPPSVPLSFFEDYFRGVAVGIVATTPCRSVGHEPRRIEFFV